MQPDSAPLGGGSSLDVCGNREVCCTARLARPAAVRPPLIRAGQVSPHTRATVGSADIHTASRTQPDSAPLGGGLPAVPVPLAAAQSKKCWLYTARFARPAVVRPPLIRAGQVSPRARVTVGSADIHTASRTQPDSSALGGASPAVPVPLAAAQSKKCWLYTARLARPAAVRPPLIRAGQVSPRARVTVGSANIHTASRTQPGGSAASTFSAPL